MSELKCFTGAIASTLLDRAPFEFRHNLANHPALSFENLAEVITWLPEEKVMFSKGLDDVKKHFEHILVDGKKNFDLNEVIETIRTGNAYIAVRNPELHPSFDSLFKNICGDVGTFMKGNGSGDIPLEPMLWLFIASPGAVTPFHFDRYSNFIMQIRGSKELAVFPPRVEEIVTAKDVEAYLDFKPCFPEWTEEKDTAAYKFNFKSGEAVHIPFTSGHYVKNGMEDISITLSVFFHSKETARWSKAMKVNNRLRQLGFIPQAIGQSRLMDFLKASILMPAMNGLYSAKCTLANSRAALLRLVSNTSILVLLVA